MTTQMELFEVYLQSGLFGSVIIVLTILLRYFLKQAPRKYLCILWLLAALRLLLPFHLESALSLQPYYEEPETVVSVEQSAVPPEIVTQEPPILQDEEPILIPEEASDTLVEPDQLLPALWLTLGFGLLAYGVISYSCLKFRVRDAVKKDDGIMESNRIAGGFLLGYFKPKIYVPADLPEQDRAFIIAHERVHKTRGDHWWKLAGFLCCCVHWYNPLVWLGYWLLCRDIEIACDERVVQDMDLDKRKAYSYALLNCGKRLSGFLVCPVAFGEVSLKQRIKNVLSYHHSGTLITAVTIVLVIFVAVCFLTTPGSDAEKQPPESNLSTVEKADTSTLTPTTDPASIQISTLPQTEALPATDATAPSATPAVTEPVTTLPAVTEPSNTRPAITESPTTVPSATEPPTIAPAEPPADSGLTVIAEGKWDGGPVRWKVTSDGTLTITGNRSVQGATSYIWKEYSQVITKIVVDDGIISIPKEAFSGMTKVTEVYLGKKINQIGEFAFYGCTSLQSISIPAQVGEIKQATFSDCTSLHTVKFAKYCQVETIEAYAFANSGLTSFVCPDSLGRMDSTALSGCQSLRYYESREGIFRGSSLCDGKKFLTVNGLESVELYANTNRSFKGCKNLKSVIISGSCTEIHDGMFENCTSLSEVTINTPIAEIPGYAFIGCASLKVIKIPNTVTEIGIRAFAGTGISRITVPDSVMEMAWCVFEESRLSEIVFQGDVPKFVNGSTFSGATATAYYPADNPTWTEEQLRNYGGQITWVPV